MHHNFFFLNKIAEELHGSIAGSYLTQCVSTDKENVWLLFENKTDNLMLKCNFLNGELLLQVIQNKDFPKRNTINQFKEIIGAEVCNVNTPFGERSILLHFKNYILEFKCYGRFSNLILYEMETQAPINLFRKELQADNGRRIPVQQPDNLFEYSERLTPENVLQLLPYYPKDTTVWLEKNNFFEPEANKLKILETLYSLLFCPKSFFVSGTNGNAKITLFPTEGAACFTKPIDAMNEWCRQNIYATVFRQKKEKIRKKYLHDIENKTKYLQKLKESLTYINNKRDPSEIANIIMANLHLLTKGNEKVILNDIYTNKEIVVKLDINATPQKNAEKYYRKSQNTAKEKERLLQDLLNTENILEELRSELSALEGISSIRELSDFQIKKTKLAKQHEKPYKEFVVDGYKILVGKNAKSNDYILSNESSKDDWWFHVRGMQGSHVLLKRKDNKPIVESTLEKVAGIAAWFSKGKNMEWCPVIATERKHVRKAKGLALGQVIVEKETVLLVKPQLV